MIHEDAVPLLESKSFACSNSRRKTSWHRSSASEASRRIRFATPSTEGRNRRNIRPRASLDPYPTAPIKLSLETSSKCGDDETWLSLREGELARRASESGK